MSPHGSKFFHPVDKSSSEPFTDVLNNTGYIFSPEIHEVLLPEFNEVGSEPVTNVVEDTSNIFFEEVNNVIDDISLGLNLD